jgi:DNA-binding MarR family transcriptional regulator
VLKELVGLGYVESRAGETDKRQRLLFPTPLGLNLAGELAMLQTARINRAMAECGPETADAARQFLQAMVDSEGRKAMLDTAQAQSGLNAGAGS